MKSYLGILFTLAIAIPASAQDHKSYGYGYVGGASAFGSNFGQYINLGGGAEGFVRKGLTVGADVGYLGYHHNPTQEGFGILSPGVSYHFTTKSPKLVPFLTGGYSLAFRSGTAHLFHYGGGATYWFKPRVGLRVEVRDHRFFEYAGDNVTAVRVGLSFR